MAVSLEHPGSEQKVAVAGQPLKFSRTPAIPSRRAPLLNEHGSQIRTGLHAKDADDAVWSDSDGQAVVNVWQFASN